jgi:hypothetical protein
MPGQILTELPDHYETMYSQNWQALLQQSDSRFLGAVTRKTVRGKELRLSQLGPIEMRDVTTRNGQTIPQDVDMPARWLRVAGYDAVNWIDEWDHISLGDLVEPRGDLVTAQSKGAMRKQDDIIIAAIEGTNYTGTNGTTATTVPSTQEVAVNYTGATAANTGMTLAKWIRAKRIMDDNEVPAEGRYIAMKPAQLEDLLRDVDQVSNSRYSDVKALVDGKIDRFLGFTVIMSTRLTVDAATDIATVLAWHRDFVVYGDGESPKARIDILPTQNHSIQVRTTLVAGATRRQEEAVVLIYCDQSPA